jgi:Skp family chaperone for outer membrane proteins
MKNRIKTLIIALMCGSTFSLAAGENDISAADTIEVNFGDKGKILIHVDSKEDLEALKKYDLNAMLEDINVPLAGEMEENEKVILQDDKGTRYLKDSIEEDEEFRQLENEFSNNNTYKKSTDDNTDSYSYDRRKRRFSGSKTTFVSGLDLGMNNFLEDGGFPDNNPQYQVKPWGSWYVGLMPTFQTHVGGIFALSYGGGVSWYNFKFQDPRTKLVEGSDGVIFDQWDVELQSSKSKLTVAHLNAHFVPVLDFGYRTKKRTYDDGFVQKRTRYQRNGFRIGAGGYVGTRIDSYQKLVWRGTGNKSKLRERDSFYLDNLRYGARFLLGYGEVDIFVNYDLSTMFTKDRGPELNAISFGFSF